MITTHFIVLFALFCWSGTKPEIFLSCACICLIYSRRRKVRRCSQVAKCYILENVLGRKGRFAQLKLG